MLQPDRWRGGRIISEASLDGCIIDIGTRQRLIDVYLRKLMGTLRPVVAYVKNDVVRDLTLDVEIPLLRIRLVPICRHTAHRLHAVIGCSTGARIIEGTTRDSRVAHERRIDELTIFQESNTRRIQEDSIATANCRLPVVPGIEGEAKTWLVSIMKLWRNSSAVGRVVRPVCVASNDHAVQWVIVRG